MVHTWIMIWIVTIGGLSGAGTSSAEFDGLKACQQAKSKIEKLQDKYVTAICVKKWVNQNES